MMRSHSSDLHEAWAVASLMKARYGEEAILRARKEAEDTSDSEETKPIWTAVIDALMQSKINNR